MQKADYKCSTCGAQVFDVNFTSSLEGFIKATGRFGEFCGVTDPSVQKVADRIAETIVNRIKDDSTEIDADIQKVFRDHPWVTIECNRCKKSDTGSEMAISEEIWQAIGRKQWYLEIVYVSETLGIDCHRIRPMITYRSWISLIEDVLKSGHPDKYGHIKRIEIMGQAFSPEKGGEEAVDFTAWLYLLTVVASGVATNFIYDLMKTGVKQVRRRLIGARERKAVRKARAGLEKHEVYQLQAKALEMRSYNENVMAIIASMPLRKRKKIVDEIANQHAKNVKKLLLEISERKKGTKGSHI